jgi:hypothetical protein
MISTPAHDADPAGHAATSPGPAQAALPAVEDLPDEAAPAEALLPTFRVLARFVSTAPDRQAAVDDVRRRLASQRGAFDQVAVERVEADGRSLVVADFVVVSVDASTAVRGVYDELQQAGIATDEVWAEPTPG